MLYLCRVKPLRHYLRGFLIAAWAGDKIAEFSFPEISFHFPLRPWFFFVSPAYAGKSPARFSSPRRCRDHPRVCGEKFVQFPLFLLPSRITPAYAGKRCPRSSRLPAQSGSPPHVQGKGNYLVHRCGNTRITPACAGKRPAHPCSWAGCWDHPRMCGEKLLDRYWIGTGLSDTKDHPRVCGEKTVLDLSRLVEQGSPPRMRGKA